jgi:hypothetical protein
MPAAFARRRMIAVGVLLEEGIGGKLRNPEIITFPRRDEDVNFGFYTGLAVFCLWTRTFNQEDLELWFSSAADETQKDSGLYRGRKLSEVCRISNSLPIGVATVAQSPALSEKSNRSTAFESEEEPLSLSAR